jgi:putative acetyltransferase
MNIIIRSERPNDYIDIQRINDAAFGQENEGRMIQELRKTSTYNARFSLVTDRNNTHVGHILFYLVGITTNHVNEKLFE